MVGGYYHQVAFMHLRHYVGQPLVEIFKRFRIARNIIAVAVEHIEINKVSEYKIRLAVLQKVYCGLYTVVIILCVVDKAKAALAEYVLYFANARRNVARCAE